MNEIMIEKQIADAYKKATDDFNMRDWKKSTLQIHLTDEQKEHLGYYWKPEMSFNQACEYVYNHVYGG